MNLNTLVVGDTEYALSKAYRDGAQAMRKRVPNGCNPHSHLSQDYCDWDYGHVNESCGEHVRNGVDVLAATRNGRRFEDDASIPRNSHGEVDSGWYEGQLATLSAQVAYVKGLGGL